MYTPFSIKWLDQQTQTSQRWQMGSISLCMFCPLKSPKRAASTFRGTSESGEKEKWKKMEKTAGDRKQSDVHRRAVSHIFTFRVVRNVKGRLWETHRLQDSEISGTPTASKQSSQTGAAGHQFSSNSHQNTPSHVPLSRRHHYFLKRAHAPFGRDKRPGSVTFHGVSFANRCSCEVLERGRPKIFHITNINKNRSMGGIVTRI